MFKVGDKVIRINKPNDNFYVGDEAIITSTESSKLYILKKPCGTRVDSYPENIVLKEIYDSPLFKAMRETDEN